MKTIGDLMPSRRELLMLGMCLTHQATICSIR